MNLLLFCYGCLFEDDLLDIKQIRIAMKKSIKYVILIVATFGLLTILQTASEAQSLPGFDTNPEKRSIELSELIDGGPGKDGIPSIDSPRFISQEEASEWLRGREPVIAIGVDGEARGGRSDGAECRAGYGDRFTGTPLDLRYTICVSDQQKSVFR